MKAISALTHRSRRGGQRPHGAFRSTPLLAISTAQGIRARRPGDLRRFFLRFLSGGLGLVACYVLLGRFRPLWIAHPFALRYASLPCTILWAESVGSLLVLAYLPAGFTLPHPFRAPLGSRNLSEFWNRRWNLWVSDWFRENLLTRFRRRPITGTLAVFLASGVWHELLINFPFFVVTGRSKFGQMIAYFGIQGLGVLLDRGLPRDAAGLRRGLAWVVVVLPAPLLQGEAILRATHLWWGPG